MDKEKIMNDVKRCVKVTGCVLCIAVIAKNVYSAVSGFVKKAKSYGEDDTLEDIFVEE